MKINELIEHLQQRLAVHGNVEVKITWESVMRNIDNSSLYLDKEGHLIVDADDNFYKDAFAVNPHEGEEVKL